MADPRPPSGVVVFNPSVADALHVKRSNILIVDRDVASHVVLGEYLRQHDFHVSCVEDVDGLTRHLQGESVDLIVLSVRPRVNDDFLRQADLCQQTQVPMIFVVDEDDLDMRLTGFQLGALDCMARPLEARELVARIRAILRRTRTRSVASGRPVPRRTRSARVGHVSFQRYAFNDYIVDAQRRSVTVKGRVFQIGRAEFQLLMAFVQHPDAVLTRQQLVDWVQVAAPDITLRSIDVRISRLRLAVPSIPILAAYRKGYILRTAVECLNCVSPGAIAVS